MESIKETKQKSKRSEKIQVIFLILLVAAIISMISAIIVVLKHVETFKANPIAVGVKQYGFDKCMCGIGNEFIEINEHGFVTPDPTFDLKLGE